jgi:hypothetical protein
MSLVGTKLPFAAFNYLRFLGYSGREMLGVTSHFDPELLSLALGGRTTQSGSLV